MLSRLKCKLSLNLLTTADLELDSRRSRTPSFSTPAISPREVELVGNNVQPDRPPDQHQTAEGLA